MNPRNLQLSASETASSAHRSVQYQSSDRGSDIVFLRKVLIKFLVLVLVASFALFSLFQASPSLSQSNLVIINEIMYRPDWTKVDACKTQSWFEWVELRNLSDSPADLTTWNIRDSGYSDNLRGQIGAGSYLVVVAKEECFRLNYPDFSGELISLDSYIGNGLKDSGDSVVILEGDIERDRKAYAESDASAGTPLARTENGVWKEAEPTPGAENSFPEEGSKDQQQEDQQPQPAINFSSPSTVSVGTSFSVTVNLSNFKDETYFLKVLIGKGDKFYDGRTMGTNGKWLAWNAGWVDFPKITVGSGSGAVQVKTDDDVVAGSYLIKVRAYDGKNTFDSDAKSLKVTGSAAPKTSSSTTGRSSGSGEEEPSSIETTEGNEEDTGGEVLGEKAAPGGSSKLNFYIILGIFGMLVGSGGLILASRRGVRRSQTTDTPESG